MQAATKRAYARIERERRFLLERVPDGIDPGRFVRLCDRFIEGVPLRLRRVERPDGTGVIVKLGHKGPDPLAPDDPRRREMTTIYLPAGGAGVLDTLPGVCAVKRRYAFADGGPCWTIDVWESPSGACGLILAEIELDSDEALDAVVRPSWAVREVTDDPAYSAFAIASRG